MFSSFSNAISCILILYKMLTILLTLMNSLIRHVLPNRCLQCNAALNAEIRWAKWISRLEDLFIGLDIKDKKRQRPLLLHYGGEDVNEIFNTLTTWKNWQRGSHGLIISSTN
jgi:hypothetical protein